MESPDDGTVTQLPGDAMIENPEKVRTDLPEQVDGGRANIKLMDFVRLMDFVLVSGLFKRPCR